MEELNTQFAIPDQLRFDSGDGGLTKAVITNQYADAEIYLQGGHLTHFQPKGADPVIWMCNSAIFKEGKAIRGGIPICWPWFGPHSTDSTLPQHGFARTSLWSVKSSKSLADGSTSLCLGLSSDGSNPVWPQHCELSLEFIVGRALQLILTAKNTGTVDIELGAAFHTYFTVGNSHNICISGLDEKMYLDKPDDYKKKQQTGLVTISEEVDRVYLDTADDCIIHDPALSRNIRVGKHGSLSTIVWNPWVEKATSMADFDDDGYKTMVCIESANAANDVRVVAPGRQHQLIQSISVEKLSNS